MQENKLDFGCGYYVCVLTGDARDGLLQGVQSIGGVGSQCGGVSFQSINMLVELVLQLVEAVSGSISQVSSMCLSLVSKVRDGLQESNRNISIIESFLVYMNLQVLRNIHLENIFG